MKPVVLVAGVLLALASPAAAAQPPMPTHTTAPGNCQWTWKTGEALGATLGVWAETCAANGEWTIAYDATLPGFAVTVDGVAGETVLQVFAKPADAAASAILPELRTRGYIPDDADCVMEPASTDLLTQIGPQPRTLAFFEIRPTGALLAAFEATPDDEVPEPPCGNTGWSTHGIRYFQTDMKHADRVIYINIGQDGLMFDPATVTLE